MRFLPVRASNPAPVPLILNIETTSDTCSVALARDGTVVSDAESAEPRSHASVISVFIEKTLREAGVTSSALDAVAVSEGPGSYTGLRIGVSAAKGLCYGLDIPLIAVPTMHAMTVRFMEKHMPGVTTENKKFIPLIDARRMEVYAAVLDHDLRYEREIRAEILDARSFDAWSGKEVFFFGSGTEKFRSLHPGFPASSFETDFILSAASMARLSLAAFREGIFADTAYFEPFYLKDFVSGGR